LISLPQIMEERLEGQCRDRQPRFVGRSRHRQKVLRHSLSLCQRTVGQRVALTDFELRHPYNSRFATAVVAAVAIALHHVRTECRWLDSATTTCPCRPRIRRGSTEAVAEHVRTMFSMMLRMADWRSVRTALPRHSAGVVGGESKMRDITRWARVVALILDSLRRLSGVGVAKQFSPMQSSHPEHHGEHRPGRCSATASVDPSNSRSTRAGSWSLRPASALVRTWCRAMATAVLPPWRSGSCKDDGVRSQ